jgi:hypothetical protein
MVINPRRLIRPPIDPLLPCPCHRGQIAGACCLGADGNVRRYMASARPRPPKTGCSQKGCYLGHTNDCRGGITGEHYVSRVALEQLSEPVVAINGVHWLAPGQRQVVTINRLTANILCSRHNSALSILDDEGGHFLRTIKSIHVSLESKSLSRKRLVSIVSGEALELWVLKIACGLIYSNLASHKRRQIVQDHCVEDSIIAEALFSKRWFSHCGLYMRAAMGQRIAGVNTISMAPATLIDEKRYVGVRVWIIGLEFAVIFDPRGASPTQLAAEGWHFRPTDVSFRSKQGTHWLILTWPAGVPSCVIEMMATR